MNQDEIKKLEEQTDIVSLISSYGVSLEKKGKNYLACCPFHNEKTPSFVVSPEKNMFNCFGCHKAGGPIKFIQEKQIIDYGAAIEELCKFNNVEYTSYTKKKEDPFKNLYKVTEMANKFYNAFLKNDDSANDAKVYLNKRGLTDEVIEKFQIGLAPKSRDTLYNVLKKASFNEIDMYDVGLVDKNEKGYHDLFINRITFPIIDEKGNVVGFSARRYVEDPNQPKYINSRETKIFKKGELFFNIYNAKPEIIKKNRVILCEGQMDVIASDKATLGEAVCSLGTALTEMQVRYLKKFTSNVIICFDGDSAGINASVKAINLFKKYNFNIHLVLLPNKMDPDEYVLKYGASAYQTYFESHIIDTNEYRFITSLFGKNLNDNVVLDSVKSEVFEIINGLNSEIEKEQYLNKFSEKLNVSLDSIILDFNNYKSRFIPAPSEYYGDDYTTDIVSPPKRVINYGSARGLAELRLIKHAMLSKHNALTAEKKIGDYCDGFTEINQNLWAKLIYTYYENYEEFNDAIFVKLLSNEEMDAYLLLNERLQKDSAPYDLNDFEKCIKKVIKYSLDSKLEFLKAKEANAKDDYDKATIAYEIIKIKNKINNGGL